MTVKLRFGLAGIGAGAKNLLEGFAHNPNVELRAAADLRQDALAAMAREFGVQTFRSVEDMCSQGNLDAVWVATPNQFHAPHAIAALERGKHVIVSKPMAVTLEECEAMNQAAERNGVLLLAGHSQAMAAPIRKTAELVSSGEYGRLAMTHTWHYTDWIYRPRLPAELDERQGGGAVFRQSPHQIDIVRCIAGSPVRTVRAMTYSLDSARPATGAYTVFLGFESGATATIVYSGYGHFDASELTFGEGRPNIPTVRGKPAGEDESALKESARYTGQPRAADGRGHPFFGLTIACCEKADIRQSPKGLYVYTDQGRDEIELPIEEQRGDAELNELYEAVVHGKPLLHDGRWGQATHEVTLAIIESAKEGRELRLPLPLGEGRGEGKA
ncbi:MAG TPA: Gfo/Idh/MocA family oxidoreductase [Chloroflexota bacterium]|nr:Gfo/Idh/MocA family oxidoreductase [Chloroflexota bacterium]